MPAKVLLRIPLSPKPLAIVSNKSVVEFRSRGLITKSFGALRRLLARI